MNRALTCGSLLAFIAVAAAAASRPSNISVTELPARQLRVCWDPVDPDVKANMYFLEGDGIDRQWAVRSTSADRICTVVNAFALTPYSVYSTSLPHVAIGAGSNERMYPTSEHFHYIASGMARDARGELVDDFWTPTPACTPNDRIEVLESMTTTSPTNLGATDVTTETDPAPRRKLHLDCVPPNPNMRSVIDRYEVYESTLKPDGSTASRSMTSKTCPNDLVMTGSWGDRATISIAAIYLGSNRHWAHSLCSNPVTFTYGGGLMPRIRVRTAGAPKDGSAPIEATFDGSPAGDLLLFIDPEAPYNLGKPQSTVAVKAGQKSVRAEIPLSASPSTRVYAVLRKNVGGKTIYSEPALAIAPETGEFPAAAVAVSPTSVSNGNVYVYGLTSPFVPVTLTVRSAAGKDLKKADIFAASDGQFSTSFDATDLEGGTYTVTTAAGAKVPPENTMATFHVKGAPMFIQLLAGPDPYAVAKNDALVRGKVVPHANVSLKARLNGKEVPEVKPQKDGTFEITLEQLKRGKNELELTAEQSESRQTLAMRLQIFNGEKRADAVDLTAFNGAIDAALSARDVNARMEASNRAISIAPRSAQAVVSRVVADTAAGNLDAALKDADAAIALDKTDALAHDVKGIVLIRKGDWAAAISPLNQAITLDPELADAYENRALARLMQSDFNGAVVDATRSIDIDDSSTGSLWIRAMAYLALRSYLHAESDANDALSKNARFAAALYVRARVRSRMQRLDEALEDFNEVEKLNAADADTYIGRAWVHYKKGDLDMALADANKAVELDAKSPWAYAIRAWPRFSKGDSEGALADLKKAEELQPNYPDSEAEKGLMHLIRGEFSDAMRLFRLAVQKNPSTAVVIEPLMAKAQRTAH